MLLWSFHHLKSRIYTILIWTETPKREARFLIFLPRRDLNYDQQILSQMTYQWATRDPVVFNIYKANRQINPIVNMSYRLYWFFLFWASYVFDKRQKNKYPEASSRLKLLLKLSAVILSSINLRVLRAIVTILLNEHEKTEKIFCDLLA